MTPKMAQEMAQNPNSKTTQRMVRTISPDMARKMYGKNNHYLHPAKKRGVPKKLKLKKHSKKERRLA